MDGFAKPCLRLQDNTHDASAVKGSKTGGQVARMTSTGEIELPGNVQRRASREGVQPSHEGAIQVLSLARLSRDDLQKGHIGSTLSQWEPAVSQQESPSATLPSGLQTKRHQHLEMSGQGSVKEMTAAPPSSRSVEVTS